MEWLNRKKICFSNDEIEEINCQVEETKNKAIKFEKVEEKIPVLFAVIQRLQNENDSIKNDNINLIMCVERLFESEKKFDFNSRLVVYKELGFDTSLFRDRTLN